jgi:small-conductance mechanosensitive channel
MVLGEFGFNLGPVIASAGVIGVAVGLGAQTLVRDILSGLFMLVEDQYGVGDEVSVLDIQGKVEKVGLRITTVRDDKGELWYIRNGEILVVGNKSQS